MQARLNKVKLLEAMAVFFERYSLIPYIVMPDIVLLDALLTTCAEQMDLLGVTTMQLERWLGSVVFARNLLWR